MPKYDIAIIGGGLAGLVSSILLARAGKEVILFEKNTYPFHRVCGEYISYEVRDFLVSHGLYPHSTAIENITDFVLSATSGRAAHFKLPLGGFGISRYTLDHFLYQKAVEAGVVVRQQTKVLNAQKKGNLFQIETSSGNFNATYCIGSWGKRDKLDKTLDRKFSRQKSPYVGVKYHIRLSFPNTQIALHNFEGGYCGISPVDDNKVNLCYLVSREQIRKAGSIKALETRYLYQNPFLKDIWQTADFLFDKALVINEISFAHKPTIENQILMIGDTAGLIAPLCGNGMAMAIHAAKLASDNIISYFDEPKKVMQFYQKAWTRHFHTRLMVGRNVQRLFGNRTSGIAVSMLSSFPSLARQIVKFTHGESI